MLNYMSMCTYTYVHIYIYHKFTEIHLYITNMLFYYMCSNAYVYICN